MIDPASISIVVSSLNSIVELTDKVYGSWRKFREQKKVETPPTVSPDYYEKIEVTPSGGLVHSTNGHTAKVVTREELSARLGPQELAVISALEKKMDALVAQWSALTAQYELTIDPAQKAIYKIKLDDICVGLSQSLLQTTKMLEYVGFQLQDHYGAIRMIAETRH